MIYLHLRLSLILQHLPATVTSDSSPEVAHMGVVGIDADACGHGQSEVLGALVGDLQDGTCLVQRLKQEGGDEVADGESLGLDGAYQNDGKVVV